VNITVDAAAARSLNHGIGTYVANLLLNFVAVENANHYSCFMSKRAISAFCCLALPPDRVSFRPVPGVRPLRLVWEQLALPGVVRRDGSDLLWGCNALLPGSRTSPQVVTIHDLGLFTVPQLYPRARVQYFRWAIPRAVRQADIVVAVSEFTKGELVNVLGVPESRIRVVLCGIGSQYQPSVDEQDDECVRVEYGLPERFFFSLGVLEPKKNIERLVRAYRDLPANLRSAVKLVIGGGKSIGWRNESVFALAHELGPDIVMTDFIAHRDLPAVYRLAEVFVFPSLYEGFGVPPLEAMACGTPVISSNAASLREVIADAALTVDPTRTEEIAQAMQRLMGSETLRAELRVKGLANVRRFDWRLAAQAMLEVFTEASDHRSASAAANRRTAGWSS
jgi:glycosyltransferase involved in cell wall biosynthesis